jgi:glycosyltransferase involved in cell wall biosynthesis
MTVSEVQPAIEAQPKTRPVFPIAYVAGIFPLASETFVYREVRGLRKLGWPVVTVSLHKGTVEAPVDADLMERRIVVHASSRGSFRRSIFREFARNPSRSIRTISLSILDAIAPGEKTPFSLRLKLPAQALVALSLAPELRQLGVRHIHSHFAHAPATLGMYAAMQLEIPWSFTGHANDLFQRRSILKKKLARAKFVACISKWHKKWYDKLLPDSSRKYEVIRCGVDLTEWRPAEESIGSLEHLLPYRNGNEATRNTGVAAPLRILTVCRLVEKKGVDSLLRAVAMLNARGCPAELTIAGDGPDRQRLEALAAQLQSDEWLHWLGAVENKSVPTLLADTDIFALPCRNDSRGDRDGIPVVLIEAMACGVPVVSGDLPSIRDLIEEGVTGLLVDGNNPSLLADKLNALAGDESLRQHLAEAGRQRVEVEFALSLNLERLQDRFDRAAETS